jgi:hypothetical protein
MHVEAIETELAGSNAKMARWSMILLVAATWLSGGIFGAYILSFFGGTALQGAAERWNESLPMLHDAARPFAVLAIGLHFLAGGILLLLGPIQLIGSIRRAMPSLHRWLGRLYVLTAGLAGFGGLTFIASQGTLGGPIMDAGFGIYGGLMLLAAVMAYRHARAGRYELHRAWAIRLFALTVGSWLFRLDYGFWFMAVGRTGHNSHFTGWFDHVMVFFFYVPNLAIAELAIRARRGLPAGLLGPAISATLFIASIFVLVATWSFTKDYWGPGIVSGITGAPL